MPPSLIICCEQPAAASSSSSSSSSKPAPVSAEKKAEAEKCKSKGNQLMAAKDYDGAIKAYGDAIAIDGQNAVYWSNRWVFPSLFPAGLPSPSSLLSVLLGL